MMSFTDQYPKSRLLKFVDCLPFDEALRRLASFALPSADVEGFITGINTAFPNVQQRLIAALEPRVFDRLTAEDIKVCIAFASRDHLQRRCRLPLFGIVNDVLVAPQKRSPESLASIGPYTRLLILSLKKLEQEEVEASFAVPLDNPTAAGYVDEAVKSQGKIFSARSSVNFWGFATWTTMESLGDLLRFDNPSQNNVVFQCRHFKGVDLAKFEALPNADALYAKANIIGHKEMLIAAPPAMFSVANCNVYAGTPNKLVVQLKIESSSIFDYLGGEGDLTGAKATTLGSLEENKKQTQARDLVARAFASVGATTANTKRQALNLADVPRWMIEKLSALPDEVKGMLLKENIDDEGVFLSLGELDFEKIGFSLGHRKKLIQVRDEMRQAKLDEVAKLNRAAAAAAAAVSYSINSVMKGPQQPQEQEQQQYRNANTGRTISVVAVDDDEDGGDAANPKFSTPFPSLLKLRGGGGDDYASPNPRGIQHHQLQQHNSRQQDNDDHHHHHEQQQQQQQYQQQRQPQLGAWGLVGGQRATSEYGTTASTVGAASVFSSLPHSQDQVKYGSSYQGDDGRSKVSDGTESDSCYTLPAQDWLNEGGIPPNHPPHARFLTNLPPQHPPPPPPQPTFLGGGEPVAVVPVVIPGPQLVFHHHQQLVQQLVQQQQQRHVPVPEFLMGQQPPPAQSSIISTIAAAPLPPQPNFMTDQLQPIRFAAAGPPPPQQQQQQQQQPPILSTWTNNNNNNNINVDNNNHSNSSSSTSHNFNQMQPPQPSVSFGNYHQQHQFPRQNLPPAPEYTQTHPQQLPRLQFDVNPNVVASFLQHTNHNSNNSINQQQSATSLNFGAAVVPPPPAIPFDANATNHPHQNVGFAIPLPTQHQFVRQQVTPSREW